MSAASERTVDVAILGAGTGGMAAYREAVKYTRSVALIDGGPLGTTCARVGCMPSKLLIAAAEANHRATKLDAFGIRHDGTRVDGQAVMARVRSERDRFVGFVEDAVAGFDPAHLIRQNASFRDDRTLALEDGSLLHANAVVIATGSRPNLPPPFEGLGDRLIVNDDVFDWTDLPRSVAVFGAGVIGLELGQALHRLGVRVHLFGRGGGVGPLSDPVLISAARAQFAGEFPAHFDAEATVSRDGDEVVVAWREGDAAGEERFDYLLAATGRRANLDRLGLENTSVSLGPPGMPAYDPLSMRVGETSIFIAGDATVDLPLLHEAADEGRIAGENAARLPDSYRRARRTGLGIVFSDPQIMIAGRSHADLTKAGVAFETGAVAWADQGRARVIQENHGLLHVYGERDTDRLVGAEMFGPAAEHIGHLLAWAIEANLTVSEILQRPFYHPVLEEGVRTALRSLNATLGFGPNPPLRCIDCGPGG
ncbi:MAG: dihydrolipoyl dehydrogenase [Pseudomonadota bacterium]